MTETKWTPEPWFARRMTVRAENCPVANCVGSPTRSRLEAEANARLIAKAPEMAEFIRGVSLLNVSQGLHDKACAILAELDK